LMRMLQALLKERFQIAMHTEQREMQHYELVIGKSGPKLKESTVGPAEATGAARLDGIKSNRMTMNKLASLLSRMTRIPVLDKTGLTGRYDFTLTYTLDAPQSGALRPDAPPAVDPDAPSIVGDHMIAAIEIPRGYSSPKLHSVVTAKTGRQYLIFDPTWDKTAFGQLEHNLQGGYGVLMEGNDSQIIQFPVLPPDLNTIRRTATFQLQPDGSLKGSVTEKRFGDLSENRRELYTTGDAKEQTQYLDRVLGQDFTSFTVSDFKVQNAEALNKDLTTSYSLTADRFGKSMGPLLMVRPRVLGSEGLRTDNKRRHVPINLSETMQEQDDYTIELPAGYAIDEIPDPVKLDLGFASYESSSSVKDNVLHYTRTYTVREVTLPADKYPDVQKLAGVIAADEQSNAVLKKQQKMTGNK